MAIGSVGYSGSVGWAEWAQLMATLGVDYLVVGPTDLATTITAASEGEVTVSMGTACGRGVMDVVDAPTVLSGLTAANTWYTVVVRRDWTPGPGSEETTLVAIAGGASRAIAAGRQVGVGTTDDQPIALVHRGAAALDQVVDLRAWYGNGLVQAASADALAYLNRPGSLVAIAGALWLFPVGGSSWELYSLPWGSVTGKPTVFPPAAHSHTWESVTGKPTAFTPAAHTHSMSQITNLDAALGDKVDVATLAQYLSGNTAQVTLSPQQNSAEVRVTSTGRAGFYNSGDARVWYQSGSAAVEGFFIQPGIVPTTSGTGDSGTLRLNSGQVYRVGSSLRYKRDVADAEPELLDRVLDVVPRVFRDADERLDDRLYFGAVAEELHDLGLGIFVDYDEQGRPDGIAYSRLGVALIPHVRAVRAENHALRSELEDLRAALAELEDQVAGLAAATTEGD